ncbi:hypothetical protein DKX38_022099 [Salix brachista]|uniref:Uncharacterized protein n=1 Tax=Salix brachista TaxID=2182728 RepID=A0A5N5K3U3_9ROSI|nr:hypothetical protein DKX38_022099 [Salix brachista]
MLLSQHLITVQSKNPASSQIEPLCGKKDEAELAVLEAALAAPKLPVKPSPFASTSSSPGKKAKSRTNRPSKRHEGARLAGVLISSTKHGVQTMRVQRRGKQFLETKQKTVLR